MPGRLLMVVLLLAMSRTALRAAITPYFPELMDRFSVGYGEMGLLYSLYLVASLAFQVPVGLLADRYPPRWLLSASLVALALTSAGFLLAPSWTGALVFRTLMGATAAALFPGTVKLVHQLAPVHRRGAARGMDEGGIALASVLAMAVLPLVAGQLGFAVSQGVLIALTILLAIAVLRWVPAAAQPAGHTAVTTRVTTKLATQTAAVTGDSAAAPVPAGGDYARYSIVRRSVFLVILSASILMVMSTLVTWLPTYYQDGLGFSLRTTSAVLAVLTGGYFVMALGAGRICDRIGRSLPVANAGNALLAGGLMVLYLWPGAGGPVGQAVLGLVIGPAMALAIVPMLMILPTLFGRDRAGLAAAMMVMSAQGGAVVGSMLAGYLAARWGGFGLIWLLSAGVLLVRMAGSQLLSEEPAYGRVHRAAS